MVYKKLMELDISIFGCLYKIAQDADINQVRWAEACPVEASLNQKRISEYKLKSEGSTLYPSRKFTIEKCMALIHGLKKIKGDLLVAKALKKCLKEETDIKKRLAIMLLILLDEGDDKAFKNVEQALKINIDIE